MTKKFQPASELEVAEALALLQGHELHDVVRRLAMERDLLASELRKRLAAAGVRVVDDALLMRMGIAAVLAHQNSECVTSAMRKVFDGEREEE